MHRAARSLFILLILACTGGLASSPAVAQNYAARADVRQSDLKADDDPDNVHQPVPANRQRTELDEDRIDVDDDGSKHALHPSREVMSAAFYTVWRRPSTCRGTDHPE